MTRLDFELEATAPGSRARAARFRTLHNEVLTPTFMPVGTHAAVRAQSPEDLLASGAQALLANTYHLLLRPGVEIFEKFGGIHRFMNWPRAMHRPRLARGPCAAPACPASLGTGHSASYTLPLPWRNTVSVFGSWARAESATSGLFGQTGTTWQVGLRYTIPLPVLPGYTQSLELGTDYKWLAARPSGGWYGKHPRVGRSRPACSNWFA